MPLEQWQTWGIKHFARKPVSVFDHPHNKEILQLYTYIKVLMEKKTKQTNKYKPNQTNKQKKG